MKIIKSPVAPTLSISNIASRRSPDFTVCLTKVSAFGETVFAVSMADSIIYYRELSQALNYISAQMLLRKDEQQDLLRALAS